MFSFGSWLWVRILGQPTIPIALISRLFLLSFSLNIVFTVIIYK